MPWLAADRPINDTGVRAFLTTSFIVRRRNLIYPYFCEVRDSFRKSEFTASIGSVPQLQQVPWNIEAPELAGFTDYRLTWTNQLFRLIFGMQREALDFDLTGQLRHLLDQVGARLANWPEVLFFTRLRAATSIESYDSGRNGNGTIYFFSTSHNLGNGTSNLSNLLSGSTDTETDFSGSGTSPPDFAATAKKLWVDFNNAVTALRSMTDDRGYPFHGPKIDPEGLTILCSPLVEEAMNLAFRGQFIAQTDNTFRNKVKIVSSALLPMSGAEAADWYLSYTAPGTNRPFTYSRFRRITDQQIEDGDNMTQEGTGSSYEDMYEGLRDFSSYEVQTNLGNVGTRSEADTILRDRFLFGARWVGEIFPNEWRNIIKVDNTGG